MLSLRLSLAFAVLGVVVSVAPASDLFFDRAAGKLVLKDKDGKEVGSWEARNNVVKDAEPFPKGTFKFAAHKDHPADPDGPYGSFGNFVFDVPDRTGMGVHAGRANAKNKPGPQHPTEGCIRTTDEATKAILELHKKDALKQITVKD